MMTMTDRKQRIMKKLLILTVIVGLGAMLAGCGGKSETKESEKKSPTTVSNVNTVDTNAASVRSDKDDIRPSSSANYNTANSGQKRADSDDSRSVNKMSKSNNSGNRRDSDDKGKVDSDRDDDDR